MKGKLCHGSLRRHGFTLIELLVVIAIISFLAALLLPVLSRTKQSAKSAACNSNLRQLGLALTMYVGDYGKYPGPRPSMTEAQYYGLTSWLRPYLSIPVEDVSLVWANVMSGVLKCPSKPPQVFPGLFGTNPPALIYHDGYGYNQFGAEHLTPDPTRNLGLGFTTVTGTGPAWTEPDPQYHLDLRFVSQSEVRVPSDMLAFADVVGWSRFISPTTSFLAGHHGDSANGLFCDGHVEYRKQSRWIEPTIGARQGWNNDHQPHLEAW